MAASLQVLQHENCHAQGEHCKWPAQDSCNVCSLEHKQVRCVWICHWHGFRAMDKTRRHQALYKCKCTMRDWRAKVYGVTCSGIFDDDNSRQDQC